MRHTGLLAGFALIQALSITSGGAQEPAYADTSAARPIDAITAEGITRHIEVIAHDSMLGRGTPSAGLMKTAQYIADQFKELGLTPGGDLGKELHRVTFVPLDTSWFQRYPTPHNLTLDPAATTLQFWTSLQRAGKSLITEDGASVPKRLAVTFANGARFAVDTVPESGAPPAGFWAALLAPPPVVVLSGKHTPATLKAANLHNKVVIYIPSPDADSTLRQQLFEQLYARNHVLIVSEEDSASFHEAAIRRSLFVADRRLEKTMGVHHWASYVRREAMEDYLKVANALDLSKSQVDPTPVIRELKGLRIDLVPVMAQKSDTITAVNVVGILEGTGPDSTTERWKQQRAQWPGWKQYIVISAHMDNLGVTSGTADSINNGANDNASGIAGLIELAKAFVQLDRRPQRSVIFLATSANSQDFYGSTYWVDAWTNKIDVVANITLDQIGTKGGDTVRIDGMEDIVLPVPPQWIAAQHPELRLSVVNGGPITRPLSDHFPFVRRAIPSFYFHNERPGKAAPLADSASTVDPELEARILKLVFHIAHAMSTSDAKPEWSVVGRRKRVEALGE